MYKQIAKTYRWRVCPVTGKVRRIDLDMPMDRAKLRVLCKRAKRLELKTHNPDMTLEQMDTLLPKFA